MASPEPARPTVRQRRKLLRRALRLIDHMSDSVRENNPHWRQQFIAEQAEQLAEALARFTQTQETTP
jgi:hypothetical protein